MYLRGMGIFDKSVRPLPASSPVIDSTPTGRFVSTRVIDNPVSITDLMAHPGALQTIQSYSPPAYEVPVSAPAAIAATATANLSAPASQTSQPLTSGTTADSGFSFSSIPWWGWLLGAGAVLWAVKGGR